MPSKMKLFLFVLVLPLMVFLGARSLFGLFQTPAEPATTEPVAPIQREVQRYDSVAEYFRAGNPNATTYRLGEPPIKRKSFSAKQRAIIHRENGGCCQVCGSTSYLEVEHRRGLQNGGGNERENLGSLCEYCHNEKTAMDKSLRRQRDKLLKARK